MTELVNQNAINFLIESKVLPTDLSKSVSPNFKSCIKQRYLCSQPIPIMAGASKKVSFTDKILTKEFTPPEPDFFDRPKECLIKSDIEMKKIKIKIPIIKYIDHIKKHFHDKPYQLKIEVYRLNGSREIEIKEQSLSISKYYINIALSVNVQLNIGEKIYLSIYMVDKLRQLMDSKYDSMDDLFDWTYEFEKISHLLVSKEAYKTLKLGYLKLTKFEGHDPIDSENTSQSVNQKISESSIIYRADKFRSENIDDLGDSLKSSDSCISGREDPVYFITDFYLDQADIEISDRNAITLKDFFTQSIIQYIISKIK